MLCNRLQSCLHPHVLKLAAIRCCTSVLNVVALQCTDGAPFPKLIARSYVVGGEMVSIQPPVLGRARCASKYGFQCNDMRFVCACYMVDPYSVFRWHISRVSLTLFRVKVTHFPDKVVLYDCIFHFLGYYVFPAVAFSSHGSLKNLTVFYCTLHMKQFFLCHHLIIFQQEQYLHSRSQCHILFWINNTERNSGA